MTIDGSTVPATGARVGCGPLRPAAMETRPLRQRLFEHLRAAGELSRADLARELVISPASVSAAAADLIAAGLVEEVQAPTREAMRDLARGRPPVALAVVPGAAAVAGIRLSDEGHSATILDLAGRTVGAAARPSGAHRQSLAQTLAEAKAVLDAALADAALPSEALAGVGVGLPGVVDHVRQSVLWSPILTDGSAAFGRAFAGRLAGADGSAPFIAIDNDANVLTLAELWFGAGRHRSEFAVVTIENGVGMGLVLRNELFRGAHGLGMELGHTKVHLDGALCRCGRRGCLEAYVADYALVREAHTALDGHRDATQSARALLESLHTEAKGGHAAAQAIFRRAGRYLALGLANVVQLFDPGLIILSGSQLRFDYLYAEDVLSEVRELTLETGRPPPPIEITGWDDMVWARGAAALALDALTERLFGEARAS